MHGLTDFEKALTLRIHVWDLDLPDRRKRYTSSREEDEMDAQIPPSGKAVETRNYRGGTCEQNKAEPGVL